MEYKHVFQWKVDVFQNKLDVSRIKNDIGWFPFFVVKLVQLVVYSIQYELKYMYKMIENWLFIN